MKAIRALLAIAVLAAAIVAVHRFCWQRYECDVVSKSVDRRLHRAFRDHSVNEALGLAMMRRLEPCLAQQPFNYQLLVTYGNAASAAGRKDRAMEMYRAALALNERPEILANIAELQFEMGRPDEARQNLLRAMTFNLVFARRAAEPMRSELIAAVKARRAALLRAKNRADDQPQVTGERP